MATSQRPWSVDRRTILKTSAAIAAVQFSSPYIIKAIVGLSNLMADAGNRIASIDVNPFLINTKLGVAVDGLIVLNNAAAKAAAKH